MKKAALLLGVIGLAFLIWFLFIKPADFKAVFKTDITVGAVNQTIKIWNTSLLEAAPVRQIKSNELMQAFSFGDSIHNYSYHLQKLNDTLTEVTIEINDENHSLENRFKGLFSKTDFEQRSIATVKEFYEVIKEHEKNHKVTVVGITTLPSKEYAYTELKGVQRSKAYGMMADMSLLQSAMAQYDVPLDGTPFVEIQEWNQENDSINYKFCFPLKKRESDSLPNWKNIKYGTRKEQKVLKATYNGNYITSDRAWYVLLNYAESNGIRVKQTPYEEFFNNPNMGGDATQWRADIYLPVIE